MLNKTREDIKKKKKIEKTVKIITYNKPFWHSIDKVENNLFSVFFLFSLINKYFQRALYFFELNLKRDLKIKKIKFVCTYDKKVGPVIQDIDIFFILYISVKHKANIRRYLYIRIMNHYKLSKRECVCKYQYNK